MSRLLALAAGGTGGHMFPAQALAEEMTGRGWRVLLATDARGIAHAGAFPKAAEVARFASATFARSGSGTVSRPQAVWRLLRGTLSAVARFRRDRPAVVAGFGGYPSAPAMAAAWLLGLPRIVHEQNGTLGRVNRAFAPRVARVACGAWPTPLPAGARGIHVGNPVRRAVAEAAGRDYAPPGAGPEPVSLVVVGGSQGARTLSENIPEGLAALPEDLRSRLRVTHQGRPEDLERAVAAYAAAGIAAETGAFFQDIPDRMATAQLVISRAGASTIAELAVIGRPAILVPFAAAAGDHQTANARALVEAGGAECLPESELSPAAVAARVRAILENPSRAAAMAAAARAVGVPDATARLASLVEEVAGAGAGGGADATGAPGEIVEEAET